MYTAKAIANEFIRRAKADRHNDLDPMKLQKLIYFAHGWYLANVKEPLIKDEIQAWKFGPVIPNIYHEFKHYGTDVIDEFAHSTKFKDGQVHRFIPKVQDDDTAAKSVIDQVWKIYGKYSSIQLSNMTHESGTPWSIVTDKFRTIPSDLEIPDGLIEEYFAKQLEASLG